jgi:hypothetical protein
MEFVPALPSVTWVVAEVNAGFFKSRRTLTQVLAQFLQKWASRIAGLAGD